MSKPYFIKSKNLHAYKHGFFTRIGGVSSGIYKSLNCGYSSKDSKQNILKNRNIISATIGLNNNHLIIPNQTHSNKVNIFNKNGDNLDCDGLINFNSKFSVGVLTADCCPVLIGHINNTLFGCLHVGWKGLYSGIILNFLNIIVKKNIDLTSLIISLGPCIGKENYQISEEFRTMFIRSSSQSERFFSFKKEKNSFYFDLKGYIEYVFNSNGIQNVWKSREDTYKNHNTFFSYRYACHKGLKDYGRMLSLIGNN